PATEKPAFVPIREVLEQSLLFCEHVVREADAKVERRFADEAATVYAVKGQLHQVFINLITNACHALGPSGGHIVLSSFLDEQDDLHVMIEDDGCGIPPDH